MESIVFQKSMKRPPPRLFGIREKKSGSRKIYAIFKMRKEPRCKSLFKLACEILYLWYLWDLFGIYGLYKIYGIFWNLWDIWIYIWIKENLSYLKRRKEPKSSKISRCSYAKLWRHWWSAYTSQSRLVSVWNPRNMCPLQTWLQTPLQKHWYSKACLEQSHIRYFIWILRKDWRESIERQRNFLEWMLATLCLQLIWHRHWVLKTVSPTYFENFTSFVSNRLFFGSGVHDHARIWFVRLKLGVQ